MSSILLSTTRMRQLVEERSKQPGGLSAYAYVWCEAPYGRAYCNGGAYCTPDDALAKAPMDTGPELTSWSDPEAEVPVNKCTSGEYAAFLRDAMLANAQDADVVTGRGGDGVWRQCVEPAAEVPEAFDGLGRWSSPVTTPSREPAQVYGGDWEAYEQAKARAKPRRDTAWGSTSGYLLDADEAEDDGAEPGTLFHERERFTPPRSWHASARTTF